MAACDVGFKNTNTHTHLFAQKRERKEEKERKSLPVRVMEDGVGGPPESHRSSGELHTQKKMKSKRGENENVEEKIE